MLNLDGVMGWGPETVLPLKQLEDTSGVTNTQPFTHFEAAMDVCEVLEGARQETAAWCTALIWSESCRQLSKEQA